MSIYSLSNSHIHHHHRTLLLSLHTTNNALWFSPSSHTVTLNVNAVFSCMSIVHGVHSHSTLSTQNAVYYRVWAGHLSISYMQSSLNGPLFTLVQILNTHTTWSLLQLYRQQCSYTRSRLLCFGWLSQFKHVSPDITVIRLKRENQQC